VIEVTGISMMTTAQGADHTTGNVPQMRTFEMDAEELMKYSLESQIACAAVDSLGICVFGKSVTNPNVAFLADAINAALGTAVLPTFFTEIGRETLVYEQEFNKAAGFMVKDYMLPQFFYDEPLAPTGRTARFRAEDVHDILDRLDKVGTQLVPEEHGRVG
jgi:aldehyde:ferredoxin oxidoreductase